MFIIHKSTAIMCLMLAILVLSPAAQAGQTFPNPTINGYRLDICREWAANCGQPAADAYCQSMGYPGAEAYTEAYDIGAVTPTMIISSGDICAEGFCDGFSSITCKDATGPLTFTNPTINGYRLDICREWAANCGQPAADAYCQSMGYSGAQSYTEAYDIGAVTPTMVISSGQVCAESFCDGFASITCQATKSATRFNTPSINGYRLDICREWAANCGQPAADAFCQSQGYTGALNFEEAHDIGAVTPTMIIGSGQICSEGFCDGFTWIDCQ